MNEGCVNKMGLSKEQLKNLLDNINWEIANTLDMIDLKRILNKSLICYEDTLK